MWTIEELLPHRPPMLLLDTVVGVEDRRMVCTGTVRGDCPFLRDGVLSPPALLEVMAQATAALAGHTGRLAGNDEISPGYLVGARELTFADEVVRVGDELVADVKLCQAIAGYGSYEGHVRRGDTVLCEGTLKVFRREADDS